MWGRMTPSGEEAAVPSIPKQFTSVRRLETTLNSIVTVVTTADGSAAVLKQPAPSNTRRRRFEREVTAMKAFAGEHTMPVLDFHPDYEWYTMPVADGTLADRPVHGDVPFALDVLTGITESLRPAHELGQVHRDLKPHNVLWLEPDGQPGRWVVADFGEVRNQPGLTTNPLTRTTDRVGSYGWAAPEQMFTAHLATPTADVFAAAAIVSWLLTEVPPAGGQVLPPNQAVLAGVIARATRRNPSDRYPNLDAFAEALRDAELQSEEQADVRDLIDAESFEQLSDRLAADATHPTEIARDFPGLTLPNLHRWYSADPGGFVDGTLAAVGRVCASGISGRDVTAFLSRTVDVLRVLQAHNRFDDVRELTSAVAAAIERFDQWDAARDLVRFIGAIKGDAAHAVEVGLRAANSWDYLRSFAQDRWERHDDSDLLRALRK